MSFNLNLKQSKVFFAGVDSGGTKCEVLFCDDKKNVIFCKAYKGVHYSVTGAEVYSEIVTKILFDSLKKAGLKIKECKGICFGVAGARERKDRAALKNLLRKKTGIKNIHVTTDAMTALYGAFEGGEGIILISGTGSVLYGLSGKESDTRIVRIGGWGRIIGDEGSGYWIGRKALNLITKEFDKRKTGKAESRLSKELRNKFGFDSKNLNEKLFGKKFEIQELTPVVLRCAKLKCELSNEIINEAADGLMYHIKTYLSLTRRKLPMQIAFIGSVIENNNLLSEKLKKKILKLKVLKVIRRKHSPSFGAVLIAMDNPDYISKL